MDHDAPAPSAWLLPIEPLDVTELDFVACAVQQALCIQPANTAGSDVQPPAAPLVHRKSLLITPWAPLVPFVCAGRTYLPAVPQPVT